MAVGPLIPFLTSVIGSNEHDELERLVQGLCAFVLGLTLVYNDNSVPANNEEELFQLIEKRIGFEVRKRKNPVVHDEHILLISLYLFGRFTWTNSPRSPNMKPTTRH